RVVGLHERQSQHEREYAAEQQEHEHAGEVEDTDALVIEREQPRPQAARLAPEAVRSAQTHGGGTGVGVHGVGGAGSAGSASERMSWTIAAASVPLSCPRYAGMIGWHPGTIWV